MVGVDEFLHRDHSDVDDDDVSQHHEPYIYPESRPDHPSLVIRVLARGVCAGGGVDLELGTFSSSRYC